MSPARTIATFVVDRRWYILPVIIIITAFFGWQLRHFDLGHDPKDQVPPGDPETKVLDDFEKTFGKAELVVVVFEAEDIFTTEVLSFIREVTEGLEPTGREVEPGDELELGDSIQNVSSLTNATALSIEDGEVSVAPLIEEIPESPEEIADLRERVFANKQLVGQLVSEDGTAAAINLDNNDLVETIEARNQFVRQLRELTANPPAGVSVHHTGFSPILSDATFFLNQDIKRFLWLTLVVMGLLLLVIFGSLRGVVVPMFLILVTVTWTLGLFFFLGLKLDLATVLMPTLISLICLSDVIHTLVHQRELSAQISDKRELVIETMEHMTEVCFMTSLTTAVGIGTLVLSDIMAIRQFGLWCCIGIGIAYILVISLLPVLLMMFAKPKARAKNTSGDHSGRVGKLLNGIISFTERDRIWIWVSVITFIVVSSLLIKRIRIETEISTYLPTSADSVVGLDVVDRKLSGVGNLQIVVRGEDQVFTEPWALREVEKLHEFARKQDRVSAVISLVPIIRGINRIDHDNDPEMEVIPDSSDDIADFLFQIEASAQGERLHELITVFSDEEGAPDTFYDATRVSIQMRTMNSADQLELLDKLDEFSKEIDPRLVVQTTGRAKMFASQVKALVQGQMKSLIWTIVLITLVLVIHFRSLKVALVSLLPNAIPVLLPLSVMGLFKIHLNISTSMVSCLAVGLAVDNAIHFLARYRREVREGFDMSAALRIAVQSSGRAVIFVTLVIVGGFAIYLGSSFEPNRNFGMLVALAMIGAAVADLVLLPFFIRVFRLK
ncbi:MAG: putative RND superfamily exporter protein [Verrucomicrobiales bacterium]|jgi:predicted RND superfamily exporter protein